MPYGTHRECHTDEHFSDVTVDLRGKTFIDCEFKNCIIINADHNVGEEMKLFYCSFENCNFVSTVLFSDLSIQEPTIFTNCNARLAGNIEEFFEHNEFLPNLTEDDKKDIEAWFNNCFINVLPTYKFLDEHNFEPGDGYYRSLLPKRI